VSGLQHRSSPGILHFDASGNILKRFDVTFASSHGLCLDRDGNFWAVDSGPFGNVPDAGVKGNQVFKFSPEGKLLLTVRAGGSVQGRARYVHSTDRVHLHARGQHSDRRWALAASDRRFRRTADRLVW